MPNGAERRPGADRYEQVVDRVSAICAGDLRSALRVLVIANEYLKLELATAYSAASRGEEIASLAESYQAALAIQSDSTPTRPYSELSLSGEEDVVGSSEISPGGIPAGVTSLSPREKTILELIAQGQSNKEIARGLGITPETVKSHVKKIFIKLKVDRRFAAVARAASP